jgi:two-component system, sensor histidine kinase YesM
MRSKIGIWQYVKNYKFNSIFIKNLTIILLMVFIPSITLSFAVYNYFNRITKTEIGNVSTNELSRFRDMIDMMMQEVDQIAYKLENDPKVIMFMVGYEYEKERVYDEDVVNRLKYIRDLSINLTLNDYINSIYVYSEKSNMIVTPFLSCDLIDFFDDQWFKYYSTNRKQYSLTQNRSIKMTGTDYHFLTLFKNVFINSRESMGTILVNIDLEKLGSQINRNRKSDVEKTLILDENGYIIYNNDLSIIKKNIKDYEPLKGISLEQNKFPHIVDAGKEQMIISVVESEYKPWKFVSMHPLRYYEVKTKQIRGFMTGSMTISILVAVIACFVISFKVFQPVKAIMSVIENPEEWLDGEQEKKSNNTDELKYIANNIIKTIDSNKKMEEQLINRLMLLKKAQAAALQSQINPHFLFNTLETINWKAIALTESDNEVSDMISSLSELFRLSMQTEESLISIDEEVAHAKRYLEIQSIRYEDKFTVKWNIDPQILVYKTVKITLQPLIENSIYHGIKPKEQSGNISVRGYLDNKGINLIVFDDGVGMPDDMVKKLNEHMKEGYLQGDEHIGVRNVNLRIKLIFGEAYGLTVQSEVDNGTSIHILIPAIK